MIDIESWIAGYEKAWATDDAADVAALFTEDAEYFTAPHRDAITPRDAIVEWCFRHPFGPDRPVRVWELGGEPSSAAAPAPASAPAVA